MDYALDYNSLSENFYRLKSELDESYISLKKLNNHEDFVPFRCKKQIFMPLKRKASEKYSAKQDKLCNSSSESEESASDDDNPSKKVALQSAVVTRIASSKTRKKFICTYGSDNKVWLRNRRFLGMVQSTLQKFQADEVRRQPQDLKQKKALDKVEAAVEEERNLIQRQKVELLAKTRKQRLELECLEKLMKIAESFKLWENNQKYLLNYIATKTEPQIFFLPSCLSFTANKQLEWSRRKILEKMEKQRRFVEAVLSKIKQSYYLSIPFETEKSLLLSEVESFQNVLNPKITDEEIKNTEEILHLDLSENESEDFF